MEARILSSWGDDLTVVNNARVSFDKESDWEYQCHICGKDSSGCSCKQKMFSRGLKASDKGLLNYLERGMSTPDYEKFLKEVCNEAQLVTEGGEEAVKRLNNLLWRWRKTPEHWAPFANAVGAQFHFKVPIFITRQLEKHIVGFTDPIDVKSEASRRYVSSSPELFEPESWRAAADNVKQGSSTSETINLSDKYMWCDKPEHGWDDYTVQEMYEEHAERSILLYNRMIEVGVCAEQARLNVPQSMYTEYRKSGTLYGWANLYNQRSDPHAQYEVRVIAKQIGDAMSKAFPESWKVLTRSQD